MKKLFYGLAVVAVIGLVNIGTDNISYAEQQQNIIQNQAPAQTQPQTQGKHVKKHKHHKKHNRKHHNQ